MYVDRSHKCLRGGDRRFLRERNHRPVLRSIDVDTDTKVDLSFNTLCYIKVQIDELNKQWIPYVSDSKKWQQHFEDISQGSIPADHKGRYIVGSGARWRSTTASSDDPQLTMVTPIAQTIEMAKSELKIENSKVIRGRKRTRYDDTIFKKDTYKRQ